MAIQLPADQQNVLEQTRPVDTPEQFELLLQAARPEMGRVVREVMLPNQGITTILTELRDLYLTVIQHTAPLDAVNYGALRRDLFRDSIRLLDTAQLWFGEGNRTGAYRVASVEQVVDASRPWRARLAAYAGQAFVFEPELADLFADVNSTGTLEEEVADLRMLVREAALHRDRLVAVGAAEAFLMQGESLLRTAESRDLLGILGIRNQEEATTLRNTILTYAIQLGREARAAGVNGCFDQPEARRRFEAASFRDALRRLRAPRRRGGSAGGAAGGESAGGGEAAREGGSPAESAARKPE